MLHTDVNPRGMDGIHKQDSAERIAFSGSLGSFSVWNLRLELREGRARVLRPHIGFNISRCLPLPEALRERERVSQTVPNIPNPPHMRYSGEVFGAS